VKYFDSKKFDRDYDRVKLELNSELIKYSPNSYSELRQRLGGDFLKGTPKKFWETFEFENPDKRPMIYYLMQEIEKRHATLYDFFLAYVHTGSDDIDVALKYLDGHVA